MNNTNDIASLIGRTNELLAVLAKVQLAPIIEREFSDSKKRQLYEHTGSLSQSALVKMVGMSAGAISGHWKRWEQQGLLVKDGKQYRRIFE